MDIVVLRLIHILGGIFWVGSFFTMFLFLEPTAQAVGPDGQRFMLHLLRNRRFADVVLAAALVTVVAGAILFWRDSNGLQLSWMTRPPGLGFTIGAAAGLATLLMFIFFGYPTSRRMVTIGSRLQAERRPPNPDEQRALAHAQRMLKRVGVAGIMLLAIAAASMSTARYWTLVL